MRVVSDIPEPENAFHFKLYRKIACALFRDGHADLIVAGMQRLRG
jgi:hypothetical protein